VEKWLVILWSAGSFRLQLSPSLSREPLECTPPAQEKSKMQSTVSTDFVLPLQHVKAKRKKKV
jgi:hypothetical protein